MNTANPSTGLIRLPKVMEITGLKRSTIYNGMRDGSFPNAVRLSARAIAWRTQEVNEWCESRQNRPAPPPAKKPTQDHGDTARQAAAEWIAVGAMVECADDNQPDICSCRPEDFGQHGRSHTERCAIARKIAQTPRMLNALRTLLSHMEGWEVTEEEAAAMDHAAQVIAAATGVTK